MVIGTDRIPAWLGCLAVSLLVGSTDMATPGTQRLSYKVPEVVRFVFDRAAKDDVSQGFFFDVEILSSDYMKQGKELEGPEFAVTASETGDRRSRRRSSGGRLFTASIEPDGVRWNVDRDNGSR